MIQIWKWMWTFPAKPMNSSQSHSLIINAPTFAIEDSNKLSLRRRCALLLRDTMRMEETSSLIECQRKRSKTFPTNTQWDSQELEYLLQLVVRDVIKRWINSPGRRANKRARKGKTKVRTSMWKKYHSFPPPPTSAQVHPQFAGYYHHINIYVVWNWNFIFHLTFHISQKSIQFTKFIFFLPLSRTLSFYLLLCNT